jgi:GNAT superfamily N-acetyltransferase
MININLDPAEHQASTSWEIEAVAREDVAVIKSLFFKLHLYNAGLDPRFALAEDWGRHLTARIEHALAGRNHLALLARVGEQPAGFLLAAAHVDDPLWRFREWGEVEALYVERAWRGTGLADELLGRALDWAAERDLAAVQLYVTASNSRAISFYERQGFRSAQVVMRTLLPVGNREVTVGSPCLAK